MTIDTTSPPGSWEREWDARAHTVDEYRREIRELRIRVIEYLAEIHDLQHEVHELRERERQWSMEP